MFSGILPIDKPLDWTSHDVVAKIRGVSGQRQVGHAGTLDPLATGLLVVVVGKATRLSSYLMSGSKEYCAQIVLGVSTTTDDAEGEVKQERDCSGVSRQQLMGCLASYVGTLKQHPPQYSAVRQDGKRLYAMARKGAVVTTTPRTVTIKAIDLEKFEPPAVWIRVRCEAGTYIRALARDIGESLGVGAYLHALRRMSSGRLSLADAVVLNSLTDRSSVEERLLPMDHALLGYPAVMLASEQSAAIQSGRSVRFTEIQDPIADGSRENLSEVRVYNPSGRLVALGRLSEGLIKPFLVFEEAAR